MRLSEIRKRLESIEEEIGDLETQTVVTGVQCDRDDPLCKHADPLFVVIQPNGTYYYISQRTWKVVEVTHDDGNPDTELRPDQMN